MDVCDAVSDGDSVQVREKVAVGDAEEVRVRLDDTVIVGLPETAIVSLVLQEEEDVEEGVRNDLLNETE